VGSEQISTGAAILKVARWLVIVGLGLAVLAGITIAVVIGVQSRRHYYDYELPASKITVVSRADHEKCPDALHPVFVGFVNNSERTMLSASFRLEVLIPSHSTNYGNYTPHVEDTIVKPGEGTGHCWAADFDPTFSGHFGTGRLSAVPDVWALDWRAVSIFYTFQN